MGVGVPRQNELPYQPSLPPPPHLSLVVYFVINICYLLPRLIYCCLVYFYKLQEFTMLTKILLILCHASHLLLCDKNFYPDSKGPIKNYASLEDPFRMQKCNLLWNKARLKLAENKLENLYSALKVQDKNELTLKKLKSEGHDKDGLKEDEMRKKFNNIMLSYGLGGTPESKALLTYIFLKFYLSF